MGYKSRKHSLFLTAQKLGILKKTITEQVETREQEIYFYLNTYTVETLPSIIPDVKSANRFKKQFDKLMEEIHTEALANKNISVSRNP